MTIERVAPAFVGPENCEAVIGRTPRWVRDFCRAYAVPVLHVKRSWIIPADALVRAIATYGTTEEPDGPPVNEDDELERMRAAIGKRRRRTA